MLIRSLAFLVLLLTCVAPAVAGQSPSGGPSAIGAPGIELPFKYDGPSPPQLPATSARDEEGRITVRAIRLDAPLRLDGQLDEAIYTVAAPITDFIQTEPQAGQPATERTEVWLSYDDDHVYVSVRAFESSPDRMILNEMRRDSNQLLQNESFGFAFDTFYDQRNSFNFNFNALGGRQDGQNTNEGQYNGDWNPVWSVAVRRTDTGWTGEAAIPFKSIRYRPGRAQIWGFQARRVNRWKNEVSFLTQVPDGVGTNGLGRTSWFATMVGLEAPAGSRALDIKPYAIADLTTDRTAIPTVRNAFGRDFGLDVKYGLTRGLTADVTYNTDFAQVEADEQQVNLTRFSLFFPEKREFFVENQGVFNFGGVTNQGFISEAPMLFYSRRIGLDQGSEVPLEVGGRITGRAGAFTLGLLNIQTGAVDAPGIPSTNFSVARVRRDILRRSTVGILATRRSQISGGSGAGETYGVDASFAFFSNLSMQTYWATTRTPGLDADDTSYRGQMSYNGDRYGLRIEQLEVGRNFNPEVGFVRRSDFRKSAINARFSPRPRNIPAIRRLGYQAQAEYFESGAGVKETREVSGVSFIEFQSSDRLQFSYTDVHEVLAEPFRIADGVTVPAGGYDLRTTRVEVQIGQQRLVSGTAFAEHGPFYGGDRTSYGFSSGRVKVHARLAIEPGVSINRVSLPFGDFTAQLVTSRVTYTVTPLMFFSTLVQYNSSNSSLSSNARFRWEYQPGSELFVVYNEGRDTQSARAPELLNRSLIVKVNRLLRF